MRLQTIFEQNAKLVLMPQNLTAIKGGKRVLAEAQRSAGGVSLIDKAKLVGERKLNGGDGTYFFRFEGARYKATLDSNDMLHISAPDGTEICVEW